MSGYRNTHSLSDICQSGHAGQKRAEDQASRPRATSLPFGYDRGPKPPCFESNEQWIEWQLLDSQLAGSANTPFCADCLPEFAERMREEGRCIYPLVRFYRVNGGWTGSLREPPEHKGVYAKQTLPPSEDECDEAVDPEDDG